MVVFFFFQFWKGYFLISSINFLFCDLFVDSIECIMEHVILFFLYYPFFAVVILHFFLSVSVCSQIDRTQESFKKQWFCEL